MTNHTSGKGGSTVQKVWELAKPIADTLGFILWDIQFLKEGASWFLRIFIDKEGGVLLEDCETMSNAVDPVLDEKDFIDQSYYLEVSSPGIERELSRQYHFDYCMGQDICVKLIRPLGNQREFEGTLIGFSDNNVIISNGDDQMSFPMKDIAKCKTVFHF